MRFLKVYLKLIYSFLIHIRKIRIIKPKYFVSSHTATVTKAKITPRSRLCSSCSCHLSVTRNLFIALKFLPESNMYKAFVIHQLPASELSEYSLKICFAGPCFKPAVPNLFGTRNWCSYENLILDDLRWS